MLAALLVRPAPAQTPEAVKRSSDALFDGSITGSKGPSMAEPGTAGGTHAPGRDRAQGPAREADASPNALAQPPLAFAVEVEAGLLSERPDPALLASATDCMTRLRREAGGRVVFLVPEESSASVPIARLGWLEPSDEVRAARLPAEAERCGPLRWARAPERSLRAGGPPEPLSPPRVLVSPTEIAWAKLESSDLGFLLQRLADAALGAAQRAVGAGPRRVLLYSGQFDPFHNSHRDELLGALARGAYDRAIVAPALGTPGLPPTASAPSWMRLLIAKKALEGREDVTVDSRVLRDAISGAPDTVEAYRRRLGPRTQLTFLMGSDNFKSLGSWSGADRMLEQASLVVSVRSSYPLEADPLLHLPEPQRASYRKIGDGRYVNARTGRTLSFVTIPTQEISSHGVSLAVGKGDQRAVASMVDPRAAWLIERHYYPDIDQEESNRRFATAVRGRKILHRTLGVDAGEAVLQDWETFRRILCVPPDDIESAPRIAELAYRAIQARGELERWPRLYSRTLRLGLDPELAQERRRGCPDGASDSPGAPLKPGHPSFAKPSPLHGLLARGQGLLLRALLRGATPELLESAFSPGETARVYIGIDRPLEPADIRARGVLSHYALRHGREAAQEKIAREGLHRLLIAHLRADFRSSVFVSTTFSRRVAESYAGPGGLVVTADIPLDQALLANDPVVWQGTALRRHGNPDFYLHEAVLRELRPEWIVSIGPPVEPGWKPRSSDRLRAWTTLLWAVVKGG
ncbi:MAG: hypothetical protein HY554_15235 [Elusimicrobia bacterium]|nr:hypothetical protein [Elusimicrobiota bacterium]